MGYLKKIRDAKIRNGRPTRQERLDCEEPSLRENAPNLPEACFKCAYPIAGGQGCQNARENGDCPLYEEDEEPEQDLGACGSYGERLYDEGTELCDCCELSDTCFANYKLWRKEKL